MKTRIVLILITLLCAAMGSVQSARAAIITVTNTNDSGAGSLRQALADANDSDTIAFSVTTPATITLTSGELLVNKSVTIIAPGADQLSVDGNFASTVFHISPGKTVTISGLTITNGYAGGVGFGGGIYNDHATLTVSSCTLSGNWADSAGGGIHSDGASGSATLTINNSTLSGNSCGFTGGGIDNVGSFGGNAAMTLNNSTFSGNSSGGPGGGMTNDGGAGGSATMTINNSTLSGNSSGGIYNYASDGGSATVMIRHTIMNNGAWGGNILSNGTVTSLGYNLSDDDSCVFTGPGDQINTDPMLGPLQDNSGPTFTHELLCGSPAIDAGDPAFTPPPDYDQRGPGFPRVLNGRIDIGAFEASCPPPPPTPTPTPTPSPTTRVVTNTADSGGGSLRQALADANGGDTIEFSVTTPATITLTSGELLVDKSVTISGPGADQLSVDGNASFRVFYIGSGKTVTISGLTITNGYAGGSGFGGGIYNDHATLTVSSCTLSGNSAGDGGGIHSDGASGSATLTINNSTLSGNSCGGTGGGIDNVGSFSGSATMTINNSTLSGNSSGREGGGITNDGGAGGSATLTINNSTLSGNSAPAPGGGIYNYASPGACNGNGSGMVTINNSTFSGNSGDGILNTADGGSATVTIRHTILKTGAWGGNILSSGTVTSLGYNLSDDDSGGVLTGPGDQINTDPLLGPLQDNGGPTFTHELLSGSPAIDAGDPAFTPPPDYDQRGPGFPRVVNCRIDIGSFEAQATGNAYTAQVQPPINADGTSVFNVRRGVVPVRFTLTQGCLGATCDLPPATIAVTRTAGGVIGEVNESVYSGPSDSGSNFRIEGCQYQYNLYSRGLGVGTYRVDILIDGQVVGSATFQLD